MSSFSRLILLLDYNCEPCQIEYEFNGTPQKNTLIKFQVYLICKRLTNLVFTINGDEFFNLGCCGGGIFPSAALILSAT